MAAKVAGIIAPAIDAIVTALIAADVAHFDGTGFRVAGKLASVHSASSGKFVLVTVHGRRGRQGMDAAGVLQAFAGIACHDAWAPYDGYDGVAGHALCGAHLLRELTAVTETGTADDVIWARQAIDALLELKQAAGAARAAGHDVIDAEVLDKHGRWFRDAADAGIVLNAARRSQLRRKRHALATRMRDRADDYLRFAHDLRVPADNNEAVQVIRMSKLRIKVSGCMRSMHGAETFCAIRSYLATATRHGIGWLDALTRAAQGHPWIPGAGLISLWGSSLDLSPLCARPSSRLHMPCVCLCPWRPGDHVPAVRPSLWFVFGVRSWRVRRGPDRWRGRACHDS
jgi:transposase